MAKYKCVCGYIFHLSTGSEPFDLLLVPNGKVEKIAEKIEKNELQLEEFLELIDVDALRVYRCPECDRFHVSFPDVDSNSFHVYTREV